MSFASSPATANKQLIENVHLMINNSQQLMRQSKKRRRLHNNFIVVGDD